MALGSSISQVRAENSVNGKSKAETDCMKMINILYLDIGAQAMILSNLYADIVNWFTGILQDIGYLDGEYESDLPTFIGLILIDIQGINSFLMTTCVKIGSNYPKHILGESRKEMVHPLQIL